MPFTAGAKTSFNYVQAGYERSLRWSLSHRRTILGIFVASIVGSVGLFEFMPQDFLPSDDTSQLRGSIQTATGTSFDQNIKYVRQVVQIIEKDPNVQGVQSDEGGDMTLAFEAAQPAFAQRRRGRDGNCGASCATFRAPP